MDLLWTLLIGAIIGAFAGALTSRNLPMGWIGNIIAGIVGSWLGESLLGVWSFIYNFSKQNRYIIFRR